LNLIGLPDAVCMVTPQMQGGAYCLVAYNKAGRAFGHCVLPKQFGERISLLAVAYRLIYILKLLKLHPEYLYWLWHRPAVAMVGWENECKTKSGARKLLQLYRKSV
jgi:hypothetical protein